MPGPLPQPDHERQRRNLADRYIKAKVDPSAGAEPPPQISGRERQSWSKSGRRWWDAVTAGMVRGMYTGVDWQIALRAVSLINYATAEATAGNIKTGLMLWREVRALEDSLLVSARVRRMARIDMPDDEEDDEEDIDYRALMGKN